MDRLPPEQLVRLMEEFSSVSSFWDRSLFYAAAADIARRPYAFSVSRWYDRQKVSARGQPSHVFCGPYRHPPRIMHVCSEQRSRRFEQLSRLSQEMIRVQVEQQQDRHWHTPQQSSLVLGCPDLRCTHCLAFSCFYYPCASSACCCC